MSELKILHRIYFGFDGKPDPYGEYLKTWEEQLPEYKIMHWNADNLPMDICEYTIALHKEKDHTFLGDYFRWWVVREYGGAYLDADIEIIDGKKFNTIVEELEQAKNYHSVFGIEIYESCTYTSHSMICKKNSPLAQFMCEIYENMGYFRYWQRYKFDFVATRLPHLYFQHNGYKASEFSGETPGWINVQGAPEIHAGVKIYPKTYFSPLCIGEEVYRPEKNKHENVWYAKDASENTCLCHHYSNSYVHYVMDFRERKCICYKDYLNSREVDIAKYTRNVSNVSNEDQKIINRYNKLKSIFGRFFPLGTKRRAFVVGVAKFGFKVCKKLYSLISR